MIGQSNTRTEGAECIKQNAAAVAAESTLRYWFYGLVYTRTANTLTHRGDLFSLFAHHITRLHIIENFPNVIEVVEQ